MQIYCYNALDWSEVSGAFLSSFGDLAVRT